MKTNDIELSSFEVNLGEVVYPLILGRDVISQLPRLLCSISNSQIVVIVADLFLKELVEEKFESLLGDSERQVMTFFIDGGKSNKTIHEALKVFGLLEDNDITRDSTIVAIGGGVIGDMAGFVASTWLRGMNLIHIPSTIMAMVDSSVGGKVAINFRNTTNGIGNYYHPRATIMDLNFVDTLSNRDYRSGLAEVIKVALIHDAEFFNFLQEKSADVLARNEHELVKVIRRAIEIKIEHVCGDIKEDGKRLLLNYGHTLGHSIEMSTLIDGEDMFRHGEGVAIGMVAAGFIAVEHLGASKKDFNRLLEILTQYSLPTFVNTKELGINRNILIEQCLINVHKDKKRINNSLRVILSRKIGEAAVFDNVPLALIASAFEFVIRD
jgi:3-dehydroquinate synthase